MPKGFVFKCTNKSEQECLDRHLFGTDRLAGDEVLSLEPGDRLFLLNVENNRLIGMFEAESCGGKGIIHEAWRGRYPYQIRVKPCNEIKSLEKAKETLSVLQLNSHQVLYDFEVDAISTLLSPNGYRGQLLVKEDDSTWKLRELAEKLERIRRERGLSSRGNGKPVLESTTFWDFPTQSYGLTPKGDNKYPGVTPAFIIWNLIKRYTEPGDLVLDPMCGSGTTIDVCKEEGRRVIGYDIVSVRPDIIENDARNIPLEDNSVDLLFIDSPYGDNIKYNASPKSIGNISAESRDDS